MEKRPITLLEEFDAVDEELDQHMDMVYAVFTGRGLYHTFEKRGAAQKQVPEQNLLRVERGHKGLYVARYELIGGVNPTQYRSTPSVLFEDSPWELNMGQTVRLIADGRRFDSVRDIARKTITAGDRLVVIPHEGERAREADILGKVSTLSGVVCDVWSSGHFRDYIAQVRKYGLNQ